MTKLINTLKSRFFKKYELPATFGEELNRQSKFALIPSAIIVIFAWLPYIPIDKNLYPHIPMILYLRMGLSIAGLTALILQFFPVFRRKAGVILLSLGIYLEISTAIITGLTKGDPNYMGGYLFIIMLIIIGPFRFYIGWLMVMGSVTVFFVTGFLSGMDFVSMRSRYGLHDLIATSLVAIVFAYLLDKIRYNGFLNAKQTEIERNQLKLKNEKIQKELHIARQIQERLIPKDYPLSTIFALYKPMAQVGGDFFDFFKMKETGEIGIFLSDVSGHGVPASLITSMLKSFILQSGDIRKDPKELLHYLNDLLIHQTVGNFITAFYGIFNPGDGSFRYSNAGHNSPYILFNNTISFLPAPVKGLPLAIMDNKELDFINKRYVNHDIVFEKNMRIIFYTDGLVEAVNIHSAAEGVDFEKKALAKAFLEFKNVPAKHFVLNVFEKLVQFRGSEEFEDDVCIICMDI